MTSVSRIPATSKLDISISSKKIGVNSPSKTIRTKTNASGKKVQKMCISHLVKKKDRIKAAELVEYLSEFL